MFIERLQRHLAICSATQIGPFLAREPDLWHVVSIRDPMHAETELAQAKSVQHLIFEDALPSLEPESPGPKAAHLETLLTYAAQHADEPLVLQCWAGRSRSTAMALVLIVQGLREQGLTDADLVQAAVDILLTLRPNAIPNAFVLRLGLDQFLVATEAQSLCKSLLREPRIKANLV
jgi:predicted protein tyrosine phosphatase